MSCAMSSLPEIPPLRSFDLPRDGSPKRVTVLRGLPASGKSTAATAVQSLYPGRVVRINNDDISQLMFGVAYAHMVTNAQEILRNVRRSMMLEALKSPSVELIIVDNTNLSTITVAEIEALAVAFGCEFFVEDHFLSVPVDECILRDAQRGRRVGPDVIHRMAKQASTLSPWPSLQPVRATASSTSRQQENCFLLDLDPLLRWLRDGSVSDWVNIRKNKLPSPAIELVQALTQAGIPVLGVTSVSEMHYAEASVWANVHVYPGIPLHMAKVTDSQRSPMGKYATYDKEIRPNYRVLGVIGEKKELVHVWKNIAQLPTFEVSFGDF